MKYPKQPKGRLYASCSANGVIKFQRAVPKGFLPIAAGPSKLVREQVEGVARHGYSDGRLLVPGLPEAPDQRAAMDALLAFCEWVRAGFEAHGIEAFPK